MLNCSPPAELRQQFSRLNNSTNKKFAKRIFLTSLLTLNLIPFVALFIILILLSILFLHII